jgi:Amidohydrolase family
MRTSLSALLLLSVASLCFADTSVTHMVIFQEHVGGTQVTTVRPDGTTLVTMSYRDNGRGPDLKEQFKIAPDGNLLNYRVTGKSTLGAPVNESYTRKGDAAEWRSSADKGARPVTGAATYIPVESTFEAFAAIARAGLKQPDKRIAGVPGGEIKVERLAEMQVTQDGRTVPVALYALTGISTEPDFLWLTNDAEQRFFALIYAGYVKIIEKGWEAQGAELEKRQTQAEAEWLNRLQRELSHPLPEPILLRNVRVFDAENAKLLNASDVYVADGKIAAIYETGSTPRQARTVIDGAGQVLMPALFDMHTHESSWTLVLQIAGGVTTSRDMGNDNATLLANRAKVDSGQIPGPRIIPCGFIEGDSPFSARGGFVVKNVQEAKDAVDWYAQHGYRQIKIYNSFHPEWVEQTTAYAHQRGLRVSGHIPAFMRAEEAVKAGYDEIQHINQVLLNFFVTPKTDTRTLARFYLIADETHKLDLDSQRVTDFIDLLKTRGTVIDTTLTVFEGMLNQKQGEINPSFAAVAANVPIGQQREWRTNSMNVTPKNIDRYRASYEKLLEFVNRMYKAGVPFVAGTDNIPGFTLHRELELYVKAGIPAAQALRVATWNGAKYTGTLDRLGSITPGKSADLLLIDGDPTADISKIRRAKLVMKEGVAYYPAEVYEAMGVKRFAEPPTVQITAD